MPCQTSHLRYAHRPPPPLAGIGETASRVIPCGYMTPAGKPLRQHHRGQSGMICAELLSAQCGLYDLICRHCVSWARFHKGCEHNMPEYRYFIIDTLFRPPVRLTNGVSRVGKGAFFEVRNLHLPISNLVSNTSLWGRVRMFYIGRFAQIRWKHKQGTGRE